LVSDIEKLIKKKFDIETLDLGDDRSRDDDRRGAREPRRSSGREDAPTGRWGSREASDPRDVLDAPRERRGGFRPAPVNRDPFFEKPYEAPSAEAKPLWESAKPAPTARSLSANIKPKRKVAALFKTGSTEPSSVI
jgi:hypothetical protein